MSKAFANFINNQAVQSADNDGMKKRSLVLFYSLHFESVISTSLCLLLDIDPDNSDSFGNTSKALSFESKVMILKDLKVFTKEEKKKMAYFMSIRNKFMHQLSADTYEQCISSIDGLLNFLKKEYTFKETLSLEDNLANVIMQLGNECSFIVTRAFEAHVKKEMQKNGLEMLNQMHESYFLAFKELIAKERPASDPDLISASELEDRAEKSIQEFLDRKIKEVDEDLGGDIFANVK
jgi:hypothetical protein